MPTMMRLNALIDITICLRHRIVARLTGSPEVVEYGFVELPVNLRVRSVADIKLFAQSGGHDAPAQ